MINLVRQILYRFRRILFPSIPWDTSYPSDRGKPPTVNLDSLQEQYYKSPLAEEADTFVLYRIIGNDLIPRHKKGQSRENLQFILEHEPPLDQCEKRWVVNRIVDKEEERAIIELLESLKQPYIHIPFNMEEYCRIPRDTEGLPLPGFTDSRAFNTLPDEVQAHCRLRLYRHKNNYVMNNNGARNTALREGRTLAKWVLPWDGNCFLTTKAWTDIREKVTAEPWYRYFIVPMARLIDNSSLFDPDFRPEAQDEPQILFRRDAREEFNEAHPYGRRPKVELFWRLGVPGKWDQWTIEPWDLPCPDYAEEAGQFSHAGWVARLFSGQAHMETFDSRAGRHRHLARVEAVTDFLNRLDETLPVNR